MGNQLKKLGLLGINIMTSGTHDKYHYDVGIFLRFLLVNTIGIIAGTCLLGFGVYDTLAGIQPLGYIVLGLGLLVISNFFFLRATENYAVAAGSPRCCSGAGLPTC